MVWNGNTLIKKQCALYTWTFLTSCLLSLHSSVWTSGLSSLHCLFLLDRPVALQLSSSFYSSVFTSASVPPNSVVRAFPFIPPRRVHLLRTHATRSAPKPDWQVHERGEDCRAGEVKSDKSVVMRHFSFADICRHLRSLKRMEGRLEGWRDGQKGVGEGVGLLVCGVACCVQVWR